jgi:hypothetical protein
MKDKDALILENLYNKILNEAILDKNGNPISSEEKPHAATVDTQLDLPKDKSGFCLHNKSINLFAFENEVNMAIMISFVIFTIAKKWMDVKFRFDSFLQWVLATDKKAQKSPLTTDWKYDKGVYFADENTPRNSFGPGNAFIKGIWEKKKMIYDKVIAIYHPVNNKAKDEADLLKKSIDIWFVLINNISGLGPTKAAFCVQLMMGKLGCIDSINSVVYQAIAPENLFSKKVNDEGEINLTMKSATKDPKTKELTPAGHKIAKAYIDFLHSLEQASGLDISKNLWDVWCDIVAQKLNFSGPKLGRNPIGVVLPDKKIQNVMPYEKNKKSHELIDKYLEMLGGKVTGQDVSKDHADIITKSRERLGENINTWEDVDNILNVIKENITKNLDRLFVD